MRSPMFDFYNNFYEIGYLDNQHLFEAAKWDVLTKEEYKTIVGEEYVA